MPITNTIRNIGAALGNALKNTMPTNPLRKAITLTAIPTTGVSNIGVRVASGARTLFNTAKTFTTKKTINPLAGVTGAKNILKKGAKILGTGAAVGSLFQGSRLLAKAGVSGEAPTLKDVTSSLTQGAIVGGAIATSPLGGIIGASEGTGKSVSNVVQNFWNTMRGKGQSMITDATNKFANVGDTLPTSPKIMPDVNINVTYPELDFSKLGGILPTAPQNFIFETPSAPSVGFNPSFSLGGGSSMMENLPLMLLLAGGVGGFALGRKKRKKKKYKKRKRK